MTTKTVLTIKTSFEVTHDVNGLMETLALAFGGYSQFSEREIAAALLGAERNGGMFRDVTPQEAASWWARRWEECGATEKDSLGKILGHMVRDGSSRRLHDEDRR